jgi:hypothetical protein
VNGANIAEPMILALVSLRSNFAIVLHTIIDISSTTKMFTVRLTIIPLPPPTAEGAAGVQVTAVREK